MKTISMLLLPLLFAALSACEEKAKLSVFQLDQPFYLDQNDIAYWDADNSVQLKFDRIISDSRCPADAICVWQGCAEAEIAFTQTALSQTDTLVSGGISFNGNSDTAQFGNFRVKLLQVLPVPLSTQTIPQEDYRLQLLVTKE